MIDFVLTYTVVGLGLVLLIIFTRNLQRHFEQRERNAVLDMAARINSPRLLASQWESDRSVIEECEELRRLIRESGNPYISPEDINFIVYRAYINASGNVQGETFQEFLQRVHELRQKLYAEFEAKKAKTVGEKTAYEYLHRQRR